MKRLIPVLLCLLLLFGCTGVAKGAYRNSYFSAALPEPFEPVENTSVICFAPYGDPLLSSSISFYATEANWYFDSFTEAEYADSLSSLCGYESLSLVGLRSCRVDGFDAKRIACKVQIEQGTHDLILYAVNADRTYFLTLLNREGDSYIDAFDAMMDSLHFAEKQ